MKPYDEYVFMNHFNNSCNKHLWNAWLHLNGGVHYNTRSTPNVMCYNWVSASVYIYFTNWNIFTFKFSMFWIGFKYH